MDSLWYLFAAFALAWAVILGYLVLLSRRQAHIESEIRYLDEAMLSQAPSDSEL